MPEPVEVSKPYVITDYKNKNTGGKIPDWAGFWLDSSVSEAEALFSGRFAFVARNEGSNFNALRLWKDSFSAELDFPRLAAARIEARFASAVFNPDEEYGAFFEGLIRAASDYHWTGAAVEDDFWIRKKFLSGEDEIDNGELPEAWQNDEAFIQYEIWEFLILITIDKSLFSSQLEAVFLDVKTNPPLSREQTAASNRVKNRFFEGF